MHYGIYFLGSGQFRQVGTCPDFAFAAQEPADETLGIIQLPERSWNFWVDITTTPHTLMEKTAHPLTIGSTTIDADGEDECVITDIHNPSTVTWPDGLIETVTDGEVRFSVDLEGDHTITIEAIPYLKETVNVSAVTPA